MLLGNAELEIKFHSFASKWQQSRAAVERWGNGYKDTMATSDS
jgi:hypothetical protein